MQRVIVVDLAGQTRQFRLHEEAYEALRAYLDQARARLGSGPDAGEVVDDLERSIGGRLAALGGGDDRLFTRAEISRVLDEVGAVEVGAERGAASPSAGPAAAGPSGRPMRRRLYRIREGQWFAGVCTGLSAYADIGVDWVRTIFLLLGVVTAGAFLLVYLGLMFVLPVAETRAEWLAAMAGPDGARAS